MTRPGPVDVDALIRRAQGDAYAIAAKMAPHGHDDRRNNPAVRFDVDRPNGVGSSAFIYVRGRSPLTWRHVAAGRGGGVLEGLVYFGLAGDKRDAVDWLLKWFGLGGDKPRREAPPPGKLRAPEEQAKLDERTRAAAFGLWNAGTPIAGTPAERYLLGRGLDIRRLGRQPGCLRFHPAVRDPESDRAWPALLALVTGADGRALTTHRIYLAVRGNDVLKAPLENPKKFFSTPAGGMIRLWRGDRVDAETGEIKPGHAWQDLWRKPELAAETELVICEGAENGLALALADQSRRIGVGLSLNFLDKIVLPPGLGRLVLFGDDDEGETRAQLRRAAAALYRQCQNIAIVQPEPGAGDANEIYKKGAA